MDKRYQTVAGLAGAIVLLDQATKVLVKSVLPLGQAKPVIPGFFNLVHVLNKGAAFGFLNRHDISWQTTFFILASLVAVGLILHLVRSARREPPLFFVSLGLILGGALGNLVDRVQTGLVVDFLEFYVGRFSWPAFNVADIAISIGSVTLILIFYRRRTPA